MKLFRGCGQSLATGERHIDKSASTFTDVIIGEGEEAEDIPGKAKMKRIDLVTPKYSFINFYS